MNLHKYSDNITILNNGDFLIEISTKNKNYKSQISYYYSNFVDDYDFLTSEKDKQCRSFKRSNTEFVVYIVISLITNRVSEFFVFTKPTVIGGFLSSNGRLMNQSEEILNIIYSNEWVKENVLFNLGKSVKFTNSLRIKKDGTLISNVLNFCWKFGLTRLPKHEFIQYLKNNHIQFEKLVIPPKILIHNYDNLSDLGIKEVDFSDNREFNNKFNDVVKILESIKTVEILRGIPFFIDITKFENIKLITDTFNVVLYVKSFDSRNYYDKEKIKKMIERDIKLK